MPILSSSQPTNQASSFWGRHKNKLLIMGSTALGIFSASFLFPNNEDQNSEDALQPLMDNSNQLVAWTTAVTAVAQGAVAGLAYLRGVTTPSVVFNSTIPVAEFYVTETAYNPSTQQARFYWENYQTQPLDTQSFDLETLSLSELQTVTADSVNSGDDIITKQFLDDGLIHIFTRVSGSVNHYTTTIDTPHFSDRKFLFTFSDTNLKTLGIKPLTNGYIIAIVDGTNLQVGQFDSAFDLTGNWHTSPTAQYTSQNSAQKAPLVQLNNEDTIWSGTTVAGANANEWHFTLQEHDITDADLTLTGRNLQMLLKSATDRAPFVAVHQASQDLPGGHLVYTEEDANDSTQNICYYQRLDENGQRIGQPSTFSPHQYMTRLQVVDLDYGTLAVITDVGDSTSATNANDIWLTLIDAAGNVVPNTPIQISDLNGLAQEVSTTIKIAAQKLLTTYREWDYVNGGGSTYSTQVDFSNAFTTGATLTGETLNASINDAPNSIVTALPLEGLAYQAPNNSAQGVEMVIEKTPAQPLLASSNSGVTIDQTDAHLYIRGTGSQMEAFVAELRSGAALQLPDETPGTSLPETISLQGTLIDGSSLNTFNADFDIVAVNDRPTASPITSEVVLAAEQITPVENLTDGFADAETLPADLIVRLAENGPEGACVTLQNSADQQCLSDGTVLNASEAYAYNTQSASNGDFAIRIEGCDEQGDCATRTTTLSVSGAAEPPENGSSSGTDWVTSAAGGGAALMLFGGAIAAKTYYSRRQNKASLSATHERLKRTREGQDNLIADHLVSDLGLSDYYDFSNGQGLIFVTTINNHLKPALQKQFGDLEGKVQAELEPIALAVVNAVTALTKKKIITQKGNHIAIDQFKENASMIAGKAFDLYTPGTKIGVHVHGENFRGSVIVEGTEGRSTINFAGDSRGMQQASIATTPMWNSPARGSGMMKTLGRSTTGSSGMPSFHEKPNMTEESGTPTGSPSQSASDGSPQRVSSGDEQGTEMSPMSPNHSHFG